MIRIPTPAAEPVRSAWQVPPRPPTSRRYAANTGDEELDRILSLPRRPPLDLASPRAEALVDLMTRRLGNGTVCRHGDRCIARLKPIQAWALYEGPLAGGVVGPIGVGHGKTILDILTPMVMKSRLAVLLIPPGLREQLLREYDVVARHFRVPTLVSGSQGRIVPSAPVVHVIPFSRFSREDSTTLLEQLQPDLIVVDEAHKLRHRDTATTSRVLRYVANHPDTRMCVWSGTLTSKSVKDYAHLSAIALGEGSPLPLDPGEVEEWSCAIDASPWPADPGKLRALCAGGETMHQGFHKRLVETLGVVSTKEGAFGATINIRERDPGPMPRELEEHLRRLRAGDEERGWQRPDGEELVDILSVTACALQLACGFYYRWIFPRAEPRTLIEEWFAARKEWHKELRVKLAARAPHLDSELLCTKAAIRHWSGTYDGDLPAWEADAWPRWRAVRERVYHETEAVWVDEYLARDAAEWARSRRGIVWYSFDAFGERVASLAGVPLHGGGPGAEGRILAEKGKRSIVASIKAHGTGRDGLQKLYREQLVANPPSGGGQAWEQLLGRLCRIGQEADEVDTDAYRHTPELREAIDRAVVQAKYIQGTMGTSQLLLAASVQFDLAK